MTYEEYLDLVVQIASKNLKPGNRTITAAALGALLRAASPELDWKSFGKRTLSELLADPQLTGRLSVTETDKGALAVCPVASATSASDAPAVEIFNPLRKAVWDAFVLGFPSGRRFMHRHSGQVRVALDIAPAPADDWVEIHPVAVDKQREWARDFASNLQEQLPASLTDGPWHPQPFAEALRQKDESTARQWNRFRSSKVSTLVKDWLAQNALPPELAFQRSYRQEVADEVTAAKEAPLVGEAEDVRRAVLAALSSLPLEKLLEIPIPAGVLLSALSKAKSR